MGEKLQSVSLRVDRVSAMRADSGGMRTRTEKYEYVRTYFAFLFPLFANVPRLLLFSLSWREAGRGRVAFLHIGIVPKISRDGQLVPWRL